MGIFICFLIIVFCCLVIWKASDGFEASSEYLGRNLSDGVRGATINAIASSMPELFTTLFFLLYLKDTENFAGGIGTTAGSAVFNGMIIPAVVILVVLFSGISKSIEVSKKVILRDGISLLIAELILIIIISGNQLFWWHGLILICSYAVYIFYMFTTMSKKNTNVSDEDEDEDEDEENEHKGFFKSLFQLDLENLIIGKKEINSSKAWFLLVISMLIIGASCLLLVVACEWLGSDTFSIPMLGEFSGFNIPIIFVSVVLASAATSVPDTIISMRDAKEGNYDDAVSNAIGSNIFDVCFALGFPLFLYTIFIGPITMSNDIVVFSSELRILLFILTFIAVFIYYVGKKMTKFKAFLLLFIYLLFIAYVIGQSQNAHFSNIISSYLMDIYEYIK